MAKVNNKNYINVLDIGSSKIVCLVAEIDCLNNPKIIGVGHQVSRGIGVDGVISDIKALEDAIVFAISAAEKSANLAIEEVYVNFSGNKLKSQFERIELDISGSEVSDRDIKRINEIAFENFADFSSEIIQAVPVSYDIDGVTGISNPCYMCGHKLTANLNLVKIASSSLQNLLNCLARCHLNIAGVIPSAYASALAVLSYEERQNGVTLMDIGAGNISLAIFSEGRLHYIVSFPFGGGLITKDIQQIFSLSKSDAERVKALYGGVFFESDKANDTIDLFDMINTEENTTGGYYIQKHKLCEIVHDRMKEILTYIYQFLLHDKVASNAYSRARGNIVLTGGGANLMGVAELTKNIFNVRVKLAKPCKIENMPDEHKATHFATIYGLINHALSNQNHDNTEFKNFIQKSLFLHKIKDFSYYNRVADFLRKYF
ncbi:MAG: cell division protein FtsA [Rickettsiales bacterium]